MFATKCIITRPCEIRLNIYTKEMAQRIKNVIVQPISVNDLKVFVVKASKDGFSGKIKWLSIPLYSATTPTNQALSYTLKCETILRAAKPHYTSVSVSLNWEPSQGLTRNTIVQPVHM